MLGVTRRLGLSPMVLIKKQAFFPPLGWLLKLFGGIPVDRANPQAMLEDITREIDRSQEYVLIITPEGTRGATDSLKSGFFRIAERAGLPIVPATVHSDTHSVQFHAQIEAINKHDTIARVAAIFDGSAGLRER